MGRWFVYFLLLLFAFADILLWPFGEISRKIAEFAFQKGFIKSPDVKTFDAEAADKFTAHGAVLWGSNAQYTASRARELLGWKPAGPRLEEDIPRAVLTENSVQSKI